jgi:hypothetical protein
LWLLPLVKHEATELPLDHFPLGDLGHLLNPFLDFLLVCVEPLPPVELII